MHILVLGGGLMGPAAAAQALRDPATTRVTMADISQSSLEACVARLAGEPRAERLRIEVADVSDAIPVSPLLPAAVWINPPRQQQQTLVAATATGAAVPADEPGSRVSAAERPLDPGCAFGQAAPEVLAVELTNAPHFA